MRHGPARVAGRPSVAALCAAICGAIALWVSFGALSFVDTSNRAAYVGLLPSPVWLLLAVVAASTAVAIVRPTARQTAPFWLSAVALLPWLPVPVPLAAFIWTGNTLLWLWIVIAAALCTPAAAHLVQAISRTLTDSRSMAVAASVLAAVLYGAAAWWISPVHPDGDEPHYLIITQSLLHDFDLQIENNHRQRDYEAYIDRAIKPDFLKRGTNGQIYSIHAPGLPVLVAPAFAVAGYPGAVAELVLLSAAATGLVWLVAWRATRDVKASWFAWGGVALSVPFFFEASSVFPDGVGAVLLVVAALPLVDETWRQPRRLMAVGTSLACFPWLHSRFAILALSAGAVVAGRIASERDNRLGRLFAFAAIPAISAAAWFLFFQVIYGTPNPAVVYGGNTSTAVANLVRGVPGLLFDQQFGLLATAPVYLCGLAGFAMMLRRERRLALEIAAMVVPYFLVVGVFFMWWAGTTPPARFLAPVTLVTAVPIAIWFSAATSAGARLCGAAALTLSLLMTATMTLVGRGAFVFNFRDGMSRVAVWLSPVVDLTKSLPSLFQSSPATVWAQTAIWVATIAGAVVVAWWFSRRRPAVGVVALAFSLEIAVMIAVASVWRTNDAAIVTPFAGGTALLRRYDDGAAQVALAYRPFRRLTREELPGRLLLARFLWTTPGAESISTGALPAGAYEISGTAIGAASGRLRVKTDRVSGPLADFDVTSLGSTWKRNIALPVAVAGLLIEADAPARQSLRDVTLRPVAVTAPPAGLERREARRGARYGPALVFLMDGTAWVEPGGIWVGGGAAAEFAIALEAQTPVHLFLRNGPFGNEVTIDGIGPAQSLKLNGGEERLIALPVDPGRPMPLVRIASADGFRPADVNPKSDDLRFLGVWIETR